MNFYVVFFLLILGTYQYNLGEEPAVLVEITPEEIDLNPGETLTLTMKITNTTENTISTTSIHGKVIYELMGITLHSETLKWETELPPFSFQEEEKTITLPGYTPPGTYTIHIWIEYEGGETEPAVCVLHFRQNHFYPILVVAAVVAAALLILLYKYGKKMVDILSPYIRKYPVLLGIALFVFSLYLFCHMYSWPASPDERGYLAWSFNIFKFGEYTAIDGTPVTKVPPVHCLLTALAFKVLDPSVDAAQAVNIFFGVLCPPLAFFMGRRFYNTKVGVLAGVFTATSYLIWSFSNRALSHTELAFFVNVSLLFLYLTVKKSSIKYPVLLGVCLGIGYLVKEVAIFIFPLVLLILCEKTCELTCRMKKVIITLFSLALVLAPWHIYVYTVSGSIFGGVVQRGTIGKTLEKGFLSSWELKGWENYLSIATFHGEVCVFMLILFYLGILFALYKYWHHRKFSDILLLLAIFVWFTPLVFYKYMSFPVRRFIPMLIPLYILSSRVLVAFYNYAKKKISKAKIKKIIPIAFVFFIVLLSFCNTGKDLRGWVEFRFTSFYQKPSEDRLLKEISPIGCEEFSSVYSEDEVIGSLLAHIFYFYTEGKYECYRLRMDKVSDMDPEKVIFMYNPEKGFTEKGFLTQVYEKKTSVVVLFDQFRVTGLVYYLRSKPDLFMEQHDLAYPGLYVFEVNEEKLEEYLESLNE